MSTIGLAGIHDVMEVITNERPDVQLLDAPVSGSKDPAEQGKLIIFASGPAETRSRVAPLFDAVRPADDLGWTGRSQGPQQPLAVLAAGGRGMPEAGQVCGEPVQLCTVG
jgi:hypothetical protein